MYKSYSMELAGRTLTVDIGRVAKQANGAALMHYGDTTVLATATASKEPREGIDFFPLSVEYEERERQACTQSLPPVLSTDLCVLCSRRITEMT